MSNYFDVIVIGAGPAGYVAANVLLGLAAVMGGWGLMKLLGR